MYGESKVMNLGLDRDPDSKLDAGVKFPSVCIWQSPRRTAHKESKATNPNLRARNASQHIHPRYRLQEENNLPTYPHYLPTQ